MPDTRQVFARQQEGAAGAPQPAKDIVLRIFGEPITIKQNGQDRLLTIGARLD